MLQQFAKDHAGGGKLCAEDPKAIEIKRANSFFDFLSAPRQCRGIGKRPIFSCDGQDRTNSSQGKSG